MADTPNPHREEDRNRHTSNQPQTDPDKRRHERPMDDLGRGHGDIFEKQLPGNPEDQGSRSRSTREA